MRRIVKDHYYKKYKSFTNKPEATTRDMLRLLRTQVKHRRATNIFRDVWNMGTPSGPGRDDDSVSLLGEWDEKETIYRDRRDGVEYGKSSTMTIQT